jgi:hypothetical protein
MRLLNRTITCPFFFFFYIELASCGRTLDAPFLYAMLFFSIDLGTWIGFMIEVLTVVDSLIESYVKSVSDDPSLS